MVPTPIHGEPGLQPGCLPKKAFYLIVLNPFPNIYICDFHDGFSVGGRGRRRERKARQFKELSLTVLETHVTTTFARTDEARRLEANGRVAVQVQR